MKRLKGLLRRAVGLARATSDPTWLPVGEEFEARPSSGIVRFVLGVPEEFHQADGASITVSAGGLRSDPIPLARDGNGMLVGVHTHLLPDGPNRVEFALQVGGALKRRGWIDIEVSNPGPVAEQVRSSLKRRPGSLAFAGACDASHYPYDDPEAAAWFDRPDALDAIARREREGRIGADDAALLRQFVEQGFVMLEGLIDEALVDAVNREIDHAIADGYQGYTYGSSQRIEHLHQHHPNIRRLWLDPRHLRILDLIYGVPGRPCQTLTYVFGSQQDPHQDTIHLTPFPAGFMSGTWIALQDVVPESGELVVYPGSHREPRVRMHDVGCPKVSGDWSEFGAKVVPEWARMCERYSPMVYRPKKGTVLIWHENLLHGGSVRRDTKLERRSLVIHSFAEGAIVYYDSSGMVGRTVDPAAAREGR